MVNVGVLALQGGFQKHLDALLALGHDARPIKKPAELEGITHLVIPGGESSALLKLMAPLAWQKAIVQFHAEGGVLFGTCAGMILLAHHVEPVQQSLNLIDIDVQRNAYGRQRDSFIAKSEYLGNEVELVFIRAPKVVRVGEGVSVLIEHQGEPVMVAKDRVVVASFHPELGDALRVYNAFFEG